MAQGSAYSPMDPSAGGGGSGWERNMNAGPSLQYDTYLGRYVLGYLMDDGRVLPAEQATGPQQDTGGATPGGGGPSLPLRGLGRLSSNPLPTAAPSIVNAAAQGGGVGALVKALLPSVVPTVGGLIQQRMQNSANQQAQDQLLQSTREALALQERMYNQSRADLAPFRAAGQAAMGPLGHFIGLPGYEQGNRGIVPDAASSALPPERPANTAMPRPNSGAPEPTGAPQQPGQAVPRNPSTLPQTLGGLIAPDMVTLEAPDGTRRMVTRDKADAYVQRGARVVQ